MLEIRSIDVFYGSVPAVRNASLSVPEGKVVALVGSNGAGKSSLLRAVSGVRSAAAGHVLFEGRDLVKKPAHTVARHGIVMVPEERRIFLPLTVEENLRVGWRGSRHGFEASISRVFDLFPILSDRRSSLAGTLSGGQQQMLAIGRALVVEPKVLLLDEPSLGLAPTLVEKLFDTIAVLAESGQTVLLSEQNAVWATEIASWVYVLKRGEIVKDGPASDFEQNKLSLSTYL